MQRAEVTHATQATNLADILERVLDKGVVIAGDIKLNLLDIELLTLKLRLVIASVDKAKEIGVDWWQRDPFLSSMARENGKPGELEALKQRVKQLEASLPVPARQTGQVSKKSRKERLRK